MQMLKINKELILSILKFGLTGLSGMVVDFGTTWLLREKAKWNQYLANTCGFSLAVINNYIINRYWTFHSQHNWLPEFGRFVLFSVVGLLLNNLFLYLFYEKGGIKFYYSKALAILLVFVWNFLTNWLFNFH